jgi:class 3 adenylate cyclase
VSHELRKTVTIVFVDVTDSTRLAAEALRRVISRYFEAVSDVIGRHGGTVEKFIGDAVMAVFGVPAVHEDDARAKVQRAKVEQKFRRPNLRPPGYAL